MQLDLTSIESEHYLSVLSQLLEAVDEDQYICVLRGALRQFLPHQALICGYGNINPHTITGYRVVAVDFPIDYLETLKQDDGSLFSPLMERWIASNEPVLCDPDAVTDLPSAWLAPVRAHGLGNIVAHGVRDLNSNTSSYFNFCGVPGPLTPRHAKLTQLLTPHLHTTLARVMSKKEAQSPCPIFTPREKEILSWLYLGKTNWEIGQILGVSEKTVKNNLYAAYQKLNVGNRTQALARVTQLKLFR